MGHTQVSFDTMGQTQVNFDTMGLTQVSFDTTGQIHVSFNTMGQTQVHFKTMSFDTMGQTQVSFNTTGQTQDNFNTMRLTQVRHHGTELCDFIANGVKTENELPIKASCPKLREADREKIDKFSCLMLGPFRHSFTNQLLKLEKYLDLK